MKENTPSVIQYTNVSKLCNFRQVINIGTLHFDKDSLSLINKHTLESKYHNNKVIIDSVDNSISEYKFYIMYLTMIATNNSFNESPALTPTQIKYLAIMMSKPLDYTIPTNSKANKMTSIAALLGKEAQSFYSATHKLKKMNWLYVDEDSNFALEPRLEALRKMIKGQLLLNNGIAIWDTLFRYVINNNENIIE
jgi:hypothetical protein